MTNREIFDTVREHLLTQNHRAMKSNSCAYRGDNGTKCAVGALIVDGAYRPSIEGHIMSDLDATDGRWEPRRTREPDCDGNDRGYDEVADLATALNESGIPARQDTRSMLIVLQEYHDGNLAKKPSNPAEHRLNIIESFRRMEEIYRVAWGL